MAVAAPDIAYLQRLLGPLLTSVISDYILLHPNGGDGNAAKEVGRAVGLLCAAILISLTLMILLVATPLSSQR